VELLDDGSFPMDGCATYGVVFFLTMWLKPAQSDFVAAGPQGVASAASPMANG
jgi:hypothetical protein